MIVQVHTPGAGDSALYTSHALRVASKGCRLVVDSSLGPVTWHSWGQGRPLLLLHGGFGSWTHWINNVVPLARNRRVFAVDIPGHGLSTATRPIRSVAELASAVRMTASVVLDDWNVDIAAFSFGSIVGASMLNMLDRQFTGRFVMIGPPRFGSARSVRSHLRNWRSVNPGTERSRLHRDNLSVLMLHDARTITDDTIALQATNVESTRIRVRDLEGIGEIEASLKSAGARLGGVWGEHDALTADHATNRALLETIDPKASYALIEGAGHWAQYERPDHFHRALEAMLES